MSLRENYVKFINHLNVDAIIPVMVAEGLLTRKEQDQLQRPGQTDKQRCDFILRSLPSKGKNFYQKFCCCLVWSGQVDLANMIDFDISSVPDMNKYEGIANIILLTCYMCLCVKIVIMYSCLIIFL
jgi:hypothetical protein